MDLGAAGGQCVGIFSAGQQQSPRLRGQQLLPKNPLRMTVNKGGCSEMCCWFLMPAGCEGWIHPKSKPPRWGTAGPQRATAVCKLREMAGGSPSLSSIGEKSLKYFHLLSLGIFCLLLCFSSYLIKIFQELKMWVFFITQKHIPFFFFFSPKPFWTREAKQEVFQTSVSLFSLSLEGMMDQF